MVTTAQWFHATKEVGEGLCIGVADKDEIASAAWYKIDDVTNMYASHMDWLNLVKVRLESMTRFQERAGRKRPRTEEAEADDSKSAPTTKRHTVSLA
jgi:hypothetical protein